MRAFIVVALVVLGLPASAVASKQPYITLVPPGNSGANQYVENVPTASGNGSTSNLTQPSGPGGSRGGALPASTQTALAHQGANGVRAAAIAAATAPAGVAVVSAS